MLKSESKEIGGKRYCVTQLAAEPGQRLFFHLVKLVGPSVSALLHEWRGGEVSTGVVASALSELVSQLEYSKVREFIDTFMTATTVIGTDKDGNEVRLSLEKQKALAFAGDYGSLVKWLAFCLEVNYGSFFDDMGLTSLLSEQANQSASESPNLSVG